MWILVFVCVSVCFVCVCFVCVCLSDQSSTQKFLVISRDKNVDSSVCVCLCVFCVCVFCVCVFCVCVFVRSE